MMGQPNDFSGLEVKHEPWHNTQNNRKCYKKVLERTHITNLVHNCTETLSSKCWIQIKIICTSEKRNCFDFKFQLALYKNFYDAFVYKVLKEIIWFYFFFRRIEKSLGKVETWPDPSLIISLICLREIRSNLSCSRILLAPAQFLLENYRESVTQKLKVQKFIFFTY